MSLRPENCDWGIASALGSFWQQVPETIVVELTGRCADFVTGKDVILAVLAEIGVGYELVRIERDAAQADPAYLALLDRFEGEVEALEPSGDRVSLDRLVRRELRRVREAERRLSGEPSPEDLHALRRLGQRARAPADPAGNDRGAGRARGRRRRSAGAGSGRRPPRRRETAARWPGTSVRARSSFSSGWTA